MYLFTLVTVCLWQLTSAFAAPLQTLPSLVQSTLEGIESDSLFLQTEKDLKEFGQTKLTLEERKARHRSLKNLGIPSFSGYLKEKAVDMSRKETKNSATEYRPLL